MLGSAGVSLKTRRFFAETRIGSPRAFICTGLQEIGWIGGSAVDTGGVEIKTAEVKVDGVAEALAVTKAAR